MRESTTVSIDTLDNFTESFLSLIRPNDKGATVVRLIGDLGAGKTTFVGAAARLLGVSDSVTSPTFVIQKTYPIQHDHFTAIVHIDAYRLENGSDMEKLRFAEYLADLNHLILIEWPEIIADVLPDSGYVVTISHVDDTTREFQVTNLQQ